MKATLGAGQIANGNICRFGKHKDGSEVYAEKSLELKAGDWQRLDFELTPNAADKAGRFAIKLKQPGSVSVGYAFLQPGSWGRFKICRCAKTWPKD